MTPCHWQYCWSYQPSPLLHLFPPFRCLFSINCWYLASPRARTTFSMLLWAQALAVVSGVVLLLKKKKKEEEEKERIRKNKKGGGSHRRGARSAQMQHAPAPRTGPAMCPVPAQKGQPLTQHIWAPVGELHVASPRDAPGRGPRPAARAGAAMAQQPALAPWPPPAACRAPRARRPAPSALAASRDCAGPEFGIVLPVLLFPFFFLSPLFSFGFV